MAPTPSRGRRPSSRGGEGSRTGTQRSRSWRGLSGSGPAGARPGRRESAAPDQGWLDRAGEGPNRARNAETRGLWSLLTEERAGCTWRARGLVTAWDCGQEACRLCTGCDNGPLARSHLTHPKRNHFRITSFHRVLHTIGTGRHRLKPFTRGPFREGADPGYLDVEQCCRRGAEHPVTDSTIIYTHTDEAPALATYSFLPVIQAYAVDGRGQRGDPGHLAGRAHHRRASPSTWRRTSASRTPSPSSASWPRRPRRTSSSCRTSRPRSRSSRPRSPSCRSRATRCRTTRTTRRPTRSGTSAPATTRSRAAPSTRCCARATPTAAPPPR